MDNFLDVHKLKVELFNQNFRKRNQINFKVSFPDNLFIKCDHCQELIYSEDLEHNHFVCPNCQSYFILNARKRLEMICDFNSFQEINVGIQSMNPLNFPNYLDKILNYQEQANEYDAFISGTAKIGGNKVAIGVLDSTFMMGSMGSVVGEKVTRLVEFATKQQLPIVIFSASGGARMQEGIFSLMQMAKTSAVLKYHSLAGLLYISVLTHPTTGGVAASFASLGDIIIAEKSALIGFAGQRVIKQTIHQDLPIGFQTAEFQLTHGMVDIVLERKDLPSLLKKILKLHKVEANHGHSR